MVIVSHDREFLDQLCTKIVETERGVSTTYPGNYTEYMRLKVGTITHIMTRLDLTHSFHSELLLSYCWFESRSNENAAAQQLLVAFAVSSLQHQPKLPTGDRLQPPPVV